MRVETPVRTHRRRLGRGVVNAHWVVFDHGGVISGRTVAPRQDRSWLAEWASGQQSLVVLPRWRFAPHLTLGRAAGLSWVQGPGEVSWGRGPRLRLGSLAVLVCRSAPGSAALPARSRRRQAGHRVHHHAGPIRTAELPVAPCPARRTSPAAVPTAQPSNSSPGIVSHCPGPNVGRSPDTYLIMTGGEPGEERVTFRLVEKPGPRAAARVLPRPRARAADGHRRSREGQRPRTRNIPYVQVAYMASGAGTSICPHDPPGVTPRTGTQFSL